MIQAVFFDLDDTLCDSTTAFAAGRDAALDAALAAVPRLTLPTLNDAWRRARISRSRGRWFARSGRHSTCLIALMGQISIDEGAWRDDHGWKDEQSDKDDI